MTDLNVDPTFSQWLKSGSLFATATNALGAAYGDEAIEAEIVSPLAFKTGAGMEAARQLAFLGGPLAIDDHVIPGRRASLIGQPVPLFADRLGYEAGPVCFIIGAVENADGTTTLTALRRL